MKMACQISREKTDKEERQHKEEGQGNKIT
jgi:hypothetical protein